MRVVDDHVQRLHQAVIVERRKAGIARQFGRGRCNAPPLQHHLAIVDGPEIDQVHAVVVPVDLREGVEPIGLMRIAEQQHLHRSIHGAAR
ncbi:hypothetical protein D3C73_1456020 [compost metagenome]